MENFWFDIQRFDGEEEDPEVTYNSDDNVQITGTDGKDEIYNGYYDEEEENFVKAGSNVTINGGGGDDYIENIGGSRAVINGGDDNDEIFNYSIWLGDEETGEEYEIRPDFATINGGAGDDKIDNIGNNSSITGGEGDDYIGNDGDNATIDGGAGDDFISNDGDNSSINGDKGNDQIYNDGNNSTITTGKGDDTITHGGANALIDGGEGDDYIYTGGNNSTITGGEGNDYIYNGEYYDEETDEYFPCENVTFVYSGGNDTIEGFNETSTLDLGGASYNSEIDGDDVIVHTYNGSVLLLGAASLNNVNIDGCEAADPENISNDEDNVVLAGTDDGESIENGGKNVVINAQGGDDSIWNNWGDYSTINGGDGNDSITNNDGANVIIDGGAGNDSINNWGGRATNSTLLGGDGDDAMYSDTTNVLLDGGNGNDSITNNDGYYSTVQGGEGDDYISNMTSDNAIIDAGQGNDVIDSWDSDNVLINGGSGNDTIYNDHDQDNDKGKNVTIEGGAGNDLIGIFATYSTFVYNLGDGNDTIEGFNETSLLNLGGASYYKTRVGNDILVNVEGGSILLIGAASLSGININGREIEGGGGSSYYSQILGTDDDDTINNINSNVMIDGGMGNDAIYNAGYDDDGEIYAEGGHNVTINGGGGDDYIENGGGSNALLTGGDGNDVINNYWIELGDEETDEEYTIKPNYSTLDGGAGYDYIENGGDYSTINGGDGDDYIVNFGSNVTLDGGAGDDVIYNNWNEEENLPYDDDDGSNVVFKYTPGEGNDTIYGFKENSILQVDGEFSTEVDGEDIIVHTDNGSVLLVGAANLNTTISNENSDVVLNGGAANDEIWNEGSNVSINSGEGNDSIANLEAGEYAVIDTGTGDDMIVNRANNVLINGGEGNDSIRNMDAGQYTTVNGDDGNDWIENYADDTTIDGGQGDDYIINVSDGDGNEDGSFGDGRNVTFVHSGGNDTIDGFNETSTLVLGGVSYYTEVDGDDVIVYIGEGSVLLVGAASLSELNIKVGDGDDTQSGGDDENLILGTDDDDIIQWGGENVTVDGGAGNDSIYGAGQNSEVYGGEGDDYIEHVGDEYSGNELLDGGAGNDTISNSCSNVTINAGAGDDVVKNWVNAGAYVLINGDEGNDWLEHRDDYSTINGGDGDDTVIGYGNNMVLDGGDGDDYFFAQDDNINTTIIGGAGDDSIDSAGTETTFVYNFGDGDDTINGFDETSLLDLGGASYYKTRVGKDILVNVDGGSILLLGAASLSAINIDGEEIFHPVWTVKNTTATYGTTDETLFTITGLKNGLTAEDDYIEGIYFDGDTIYLSADVLGTTNVSVTGDGYYLALGEDVEEPEETDPEWNLLGSTAKLTTSTTAGYTLSDDYKSITYTAERSSITLATVTGLKRNLSEDDLNDGIYVDNDNKEITLTSDVLGTTNVSISGDYTLALGDDVYPPEEGDAEWKVSGTTSTTATLSNMTSAGYELSDDYKSVTYTPAKSGDAIATITGLAKGLKAEDGYIEGIDFDGDVITLSENVLGTTNVKITSDSGYTLALDVDVPESTSEPEWKITSKASATTTTAVLGDTTTAGYTLSEDAQSITYTSDKTTTIATLSNLAKGLTVDELIDGIEYDTDSETITLYASVLGTAKVTVKDSTKNTNYTLALGDDVATEPESTDSWTLSGTKAIFKRVESAYFSESTNGKTINYTAATKGTTLITVSGLAKGLSAEDGVIDGIDFDGDSVITLSADVLGTTKVTVKEKGFTLALGDDVSEPEELDSTWTVKSTTATLSNSTSEGYTLSDDERTITYNAAKTGKAIATVSGLVSGLSAEDGVIEGIDFDGDSIITLSADVLGTKKVTVKEKGFTLALGDDVSEPEELDSTWTVKGTTATLSNSTSEGYTLSDDERTITYNAAKAGKAIATVSGLVSGLSAEDGVIDGIEVDEDGMITLSADVLGTKKVTLKGDGYELALGDDVNEPQEVEDAWTIKSTTATLSDGTTAGYTCDGKSVTFNAAKAGKAKATISGLVSGLSPDEDGVIDGIELDEDGTITLSADVLGTKKVTLKGTGYALALSDDVDAVGYDDWTFSTKKQVTTIKGDATAGYTCDGSTVTYTKAKSATIATITGVTDENGVDFDGETVTLSGDSLTNKVTVSGTIAFEFDDNFNDATITGSKAADIITVNGTGVTINAGKGDDQLTTAGGNTFVYASGDGNDVIADFTDNDRIQITSGTAKVTTDGEDVKVTVGKGTITLTEAAGQTIYLLDKKGNETEYATTSPDSDSYWFIDDDFTTTPQLGDITAEVNSMLGEMDIATDPTQLVQETPIVTTSTKK